MKDVIFPVAKQPENNLNPIHDVLSGIETVLHIEECLLNEHLSHINHWMRDTSPIYWLMVCRLNEAALLTAGYYADCGKFSAAGDLLVNPREIVVHIAGQPAASKKRHSRISDQFGPYNQSAAVFQKWFCHNAALEQKQPPLIPFLYEKLCASGRIAEGYLETVNTRMKKIADTISFQAAWGVGSFEDMADHLIHCSENDRRLTENNLCRFTTDLFRHIEIEIRQIRNEPNFSSSILSGI